MKKIVPFNKQLFFENNIEEITSISLEHTLHLESDNLITGEFIIQGDYKIKETDTLTNDFNFKIPFDINIDERYITDKIKIDIDNFYYEIVDSNVLSVNIDVELDKLDERKIEINKDEELKQVEIIDEVKEETTTKEISKKDYVTYKVYIVKEQDSLETIMKKYNTTKEEIENYNNIDNINIGDKIIIPTNG